MLIFIIYVITVNDTAISDCALLSFGKKWFILNFNLQIMTNIFQFQRITQKIYFITLSSIYFKWAIKNRNVFFKSNSLHFICYYNLEFQFFEIFSIIETWSLFPQIPPSFRHSCQHSCIRLSTKNMYHGK